MKRMLVTVIVPVIAVCAGAFILFLLLTPTANAPTTEPGKVMSIERYITQNISSLSPEKEVLGGKFYVTSIQLTSGDGASGTGVVQYEDGHIALTADFSYDISDEKGITIKSFIVRN